MHEHEHHDHGHDHEPGCCGHESDDQGPIVPVGGIGGEHADTAAKSLANALRWSFGILTFAMIVVGVLWCFTGVKTINPGNEGIIKVFGAIEGTAMPGLAYTWPYPIGEIVVVQTMPRDQDRKSVV